MAMSLSHVIKQFKKGGGGELWDRLLKLLVILKWLSWRNGIYYDP